MHAEVLAFIGRVVGPRDTTKDKVLEIGSLNINGTPRPFFAASEAYVGIDRREGRDVDVVTEAKDYQPDDDFTVAVCCEVLEHAAEPSDVIECAWRSLAPGGLLIVTAAGPDRERHDENGLASTTVAYTPIDKRLLSKLLSDWENVSIEYGESHGHKHGDIYATATKPKSKQAIKKVEDRQEKAEVAEENAPDESAP